MKVLDIKTQLQKMIEQENDIHVLEAIRTLLQKTRLNPVLKDKLTSRAMRSDEDIKAGRILTKEEVIRRTNK
ncbi:MAG: hypothetical protein MI921_19020 [Cytophagales bacterium]|nr:hypothetical protein [Cytophagales bacterium]